MKIEQLLEARRNPDLNPKTDINEIVEGYIKKDPSLVYHFKNREILSANINPNTDSPIGIYAYTSEAVASALRRGGVHRLPYASGRRKLFVLKPKGNIINLQTYDNFMSDAIKVSKFLLSEYNKMDTELELGLGDDSVKDYLVMMMEEFADNFSVDGEAIWKFVYEVLEYFNESFYIPRLQQISKATNTIFMKVLGWDGVVDNGGSIIHRQEPHQIALFHPKAYELIGMYDNVERDGEGRATQGDASWRNEKKE